MERGLLGAGVVAALASSASILGEVAEVEYSLEREVESEGDRGAPSGEDELSTSALLSLLIRLNLQNKRTNFSTVKTSQPHFQASI